MLRWLRGMTKKNPLLYKGFSRDYTYRTDGVRTHDPYPVKIVLSR